ncbi:hypothetical protein ABPG72_021528 [Tetrahymena utriculariae]
MYDLFTKNTTQIWCEVDQRKICNLTSISMMVLDNHIYGQYGVEYAIKFGIVTEDEYPYTAVGGDCQINNPTTDGFYPKAYIKLQQTSEDLKSSLNFSPVTVSVDASNWSSYQSGVFDNCGETTEQQLNHAVITVGYDTDGNWIIRNSWSTSWGEDGYMRLAAAFVCEVFENFQNQNKKVT